MCIAKRAGALVVALAIAISLIGGMGVRAGEGEAENGNRGALLSEMLEAYTQRRGLEAELEAIDDDVARAAAEQWRKVFLDSDYRLLVFGRDDPTEIPVSGRHAFVVLGYELDSGEMTPELKGRCDAAAAAANAFPDSIVVCSGGATGKNNPEGHTEAGLMKDYLVENGVADERVFTDERAMTTVENAVNTFEILKEQGIETMTIVTSAYHQRRGQVLYRAIAEKYLSESRYSVEIIGNYCYDTQASDEVFENEAKIAIRQLSGILDLSDEESAALKGLTAGKPKPVDYSLESSWAMYGLGGDKDVDVFLIAPTVDTNDENNMSLDDEKNRQRFIGALNMEVGIYSDCANVYAPFYRQAAMKVYMMPEEEREKWLGAAYRDISAAFSWYLEHENGGRPIILAGFSQGADMCLRLMAEYFSDEALLDRLVATYAIGWPCGEELVKSYPWIRPAASGDDIGVVVSFDCEAPEVDETFINPAGRRAFSINPLNWRTDSTPADKSENLGACFTDYSGEILSEVAGLCGCYIDEARGALKVTDVDPADYPALVPGLPEGSYHVYDYQFFYRNLEENVSSRVEAYLSRELAAIPDWNKDSEAMRSIMDYVDAVCDPQSDKYVDTAGRVAVFDLDGTLIGERFPTYFDVCLFLHRALHDPSYTAAEDVAAYAAELERTLKEGLPEPDSPRSTAQMEAECFAGMSVDEYRAYVRAFMDEPAAGFSGMTYAEGFFRPMVSLVEYLFDNGFTVFVSSGTERVMARELIARRLGDWIPPYCVIGSDFTMCAANQDGKEGRSYTYAPDDEVLMEGNLAVKNQKANKVFSIVSEIGIPPVIVFGNSSGDLAMAEYCMQHGGRAYMLLCDDTERDYGDPDEAAAFAEECVRRGIETISMRDEFDSIYGDEAVMTEAELEPAA